MKESKKGGLGFAGIVIGVVVAVVMLSLIWGLQSSATNYESHTDTQSIGAIPVNITLTQDRTIALTSVLNSTGDAWNANNYTDYVSSGYVTILANSSNDTGYASASVTYTYQQTGYINSPIARLVVGFIALMLACGIIVYIMKTKQD